MRNSIMASAAATLLSTLTLAASAAAAPAEKPASERIEDIRRDAIGDALATATRISTTLGHALQAIARQRPPLRNAYYEIAVRHPDRLAWTVTYVDGTSCGGLFNGVALTYENAAAPVPLKGTVDALLDLVAASPDCGLPIAGLLHSKLLTTAAGIVLDEIRLGSDRARGLDYHRIGMRHADIDWQFHVTASAEALAIRHLATFTRDPDGSAYVITFQSWQAGSEPGTAAAVSGLAGGQSPF